jgi:uncharacterized protein YbcC (UPF0753/DUF2309 family)
MKTTSSTYNESEILHRIRHYLPSQSPLKDFIHHNTLHAFQDKKFHDGLRTASEIFGYKTYLPISEYRDLFRRGIIVPEILHKVMISRLNSKNINQLRDDVMIRSYDRHTHHRIGRLRNSWKNALRYDYTKQSQPILFRVISSYVDQGIAVTRFPRSQNGFLDSIRQLEKSSAIGIFKSKRAKEHLFDENISIEKLLTVLVGNESYFEEYLFDQQFEHPGWSGMVSVLENNTETLFDKRKVTLQEFILFELLLEIETLDKHFGQRWQPLASHIKVKIGDLFDPVAESALMTALSVWHEAYEWSYYDWVLCGIKKSASVTEIADKKVPSFQAIFCIDDRECSLRRYLETTDKWARTYGTAGFFNVEFYFQPEGGKFYTKSCPAPLSPKFLVREENKTIKRKKDVHFSKRSHGVLGGWLISQTIGFLDALKLLLIIFRPTLSSAASVSFHHMDKHASLSIEHIPGEPDVDGLQVGFTIEEMADRIEGLLKSIGLIDQFAPIVYFIGHGATSVNNTYYAGYDCGACSGRPGSVNSRVAAHMANDIRVRKILAERGIAIPDETQFVGGLQDTTRDEVEFFDEHVLNEDNRQRHAFNISTFHIALEKNAKERSRRFYMMDHQKSSKSIHAKIKVRSVSLFEPRPEYNHATNTLCIVGRRELTEKLFLDRRSFLNSYNYQIDPDGKHLLNILKAVAPVCGGINLEYYFSRVDNQRLGAGSKLPHNVIGLIGVANGADGDLRTGLPMQMVEIHDPLRLLVIVQHFPNVVINILKQSPPTMEWFMNEWIHLIIADPETNNFYKFRDGAFEMYDPTEREIKTVDDLHSYISTRRDNHEPLLTK